MANTSTDAKAAVILAAGKGTRMKSENPKVATLLAGKPLLVHVIEHLVSAGFRRLIFIVGYKQEVVREIVPEIDDVSMEFAVQAEQLGTGHAFQCSAEALSDYRGPVLVASGDMPMLKPESFGKLLSSHESANNAVTVLSAHLDEPTGYGRLVRDDDGRLTRIVEEKDADDDVRKIQEINTGTYIFQSPGIFDVLRRIGSNNAQNEYYLPDAVELYRNEGANVGSMILDNAVEARGVNSPDDLAALEREMQAARVSQN